MKALSLTQPWAQLIAVHAKKIETRSWPTSFRGVLAIHAAKGLGAVGGKRGLKELCGEEPFCSVLTEAIEAHERRYWRGEGVLKKMVDHPFMPFGALVAVARLVRCESTVGSAVWKPRPGTNEYAFGNYDPGRFMWMLEEVEPLPVPVRCNGALGLWTVPADVGAQVVEQLSTDKRTRLAYEARVK